MSPRTRGYPLLRWLGFAILASTWGLFGLQFMAVITWGAILMPLVGIVILTPFVVVNYGVWGWWLKPTASQRDQTNHTF